MEKTREERDGVWLDFYINAKVSSRLPCKGHAMVYGSLWFYRVNKFAVG